MIANMAPIFPLRRIMFLSCALVVALRLPTASGASGFLRFAPSPCEAPPHLTTEQTALLQETVDLVEKIKATRYEQHLSKLDRWSGKVQPLPQALASIQEAYAGIKTRTTTRLFNHLFARAVVLALRTLLFSSEMDFRHPKWESSREHPDWDDPRYSGNWVAKQLGEFLKDIDGAEAEEGVGFVYHARFEPR